MFVFLFVYLIIRLTVPPEDPVDRNDNRRHPHKEGQCGDDNGDKDIFIHDVGFYKSRRYVLCTGILSTQRPNPVNTEAKFAYNERFLYLCIAKMAPSLPYLCGLAATVFIAVSLTVAAVRWFHMCRPFNRNPRYYYPGRPYVTGIYLNALMLLPYVLHPESPDAWYLVRLYFLPVTLYHFTIMLFSYFGSVMQWKKWRWPMLIVSFPVVLALVAAFGLAVWPGDQVGSVAPALSWAVLYVLGIIITGVCIVAMALILGWVRRFDSDDFSNPADFPVTSARRWIVLVGLNMVLCWVGAVVGSPRLLSVLMLLFAASSVLFIVTALHPHRSRQVEEEAGEPVPRPVPDTLPGDPSSPSVIGLVSPLPGDPSYGASGKKQAILQAIHAVVVEQEAYLDAHLTIQDVADRIGYSRSTLSGLFKAELGGFFNYVNRLRLAHVAAYQQAHPGARLQEALEASGFNSRQAYYNVKDRLSEDA